MKMTKLIILMKNGDRYELNANKDFDQRNNLTIKDKYLIKNTYSNAFTSFTAASTARFPYSTLFSNNSFIVFTPPLQFHHFLLIDFLFLQLYLHF